MMDVKLKCSEFLGLVEKCDEVLESAKEMDDRRRVPTSADVAEVYSTYRLRYIRRTRPE